MIENINTIAEKIRRNNASINTPYTAERACFNITFQTNGHIWLYIDTLWSREFKKHRERISRIFHTKEILYCGEVGTETKRTYYAMWAVRLK